jgi:hypothetical protein
MMNITSVAGMIILSRRAERPARTLLPRSCPTSERTEQIGVSLALSWLSESMVPISTPRAPHEIGTIFHLDDGYQPLVVVGTFADAGLVLGIDRPDKRLQVSIG